MKIKKIIFLGSKPIGYKCLEYLIVNSEILGIQVIGCLTSDEHRFGGIFSIKALASEHNIKIIGSLDELLLEEEIDIIISVQYHLIIKQKHIDKAKEIAVNLHMAPLPEYRGCNQFSFAIYQQAKEFGTTLHKMDSGIDSGDILFEKRFHIPDQCTVKRLYDLTYDASLTLFEEKIGNIIKGDYTPVSQKQLVESRGTQLIFRKDIEQLKAIELSQDTINKVRATSMSILGFEPPFGMDGDKKIYLIYEDFYNQLLNKE
jgi:methionyl-tRNA formyltransferase